MVDYDPYAVEHLVRERLAALRAEAERERLTKALAPPAGVRAGLGTLLIRTGAWLLREEHRRARARIGSPRTEP